MKRLFLAVILIFCSGQFVKADTDIIDWQKIDENVYINPEGIVGTEDRYGYSFLLKSFNKGQYEPVRGQYISYTIASYTIDCTKMTYKIGVIDSYGAEDNFINGDYNKYAAFQPIVQGTAVGNAASKLCRAL